MSLPDIINGSFEMFGGLFVFMSVIKILHDKCAMGISWLTIGYFALWGFWNLYYYPHLGQTFSFYGGIGVAISNTIYVILIIWYSRRVTP